MKGLLKALSLAAAVLFCLSGCSPESARSTLRGATMGTTWSVVYRDQAVPPSEQLMAAIELRLREINAAMSTYLPDSEISRLNRGDLAPSERLSEDFVRVLGLALEVSRLTKGAYDVTVGPLVDLWGFGPEPFTGTVPAPDAIEQARSLVGSDGVTWHPAARHVSLTDGMRVDMSSIAKGYAVDELVELLQGLGVEDMLVEIGGELRARGERPEGGAWLLAVESPVPSEGRFVTALSVTDEGVATSGDYRNYFEIDGKRYSHLVDPRTGAPVDHELVSVTVVHKQCAMADALATGLIVMGLEEAYELARNEELAAYFVTYGADGLAVHSTPEFERYATDQSG